MRDMPPIEPSPDGLPHVHRMEFFNTIIGAMRDAQDELEQDGLSQDLVDQIVANTIAHALAHADCKLIEQEQHKMNGSHRVLS
jgi:hypothetical protein